jgi:uncharacterized protein (DUF427 family)
MTEIRVSDAEGVWTVRTVDGVLVESRAAKALTEGSMDPVIYFPRADVAMALLERSDSTTRCPHKGQANYYSYAGAAGGIPDVAWTYEAVTNPDAKDVEGYLAFDGGKVTVERV